MEQIQARVERVGATEVKPMKPTTLYVAYSNDGEIDRQSDNKEYGELWAAQGYRIVAYTLDPHATPQPTVKLPTDEEIEGMSLAGIWSNDEQLAYRLGARDMRNHIAAKLKGDKQ